MAINKDLGSTARFQSDAEDVDVDFGLMRGYSGVYVLFIYLLGDGFAVTYLLTVGVELSHN